MSVLRDWVLNQGVTEIEMNERQFWNFAAFQPLSEKPWVTFMGRPLRGLTCPKTRRSALAFTNPQRVGAM